MTTVTFVANDRDLSDFYGVLDGIRHKLARDDRNTLSDWCTLLSDLYRTNSEGYYILFRGREIDLVRLACEEYYHRHDHGRQVDLCKEILNVLNGVVKESIIENEQHVQNKERAMLQKRMADGDAWDTGMADDRAWSVDENVQGFVDEPQPVVYDGSDRDDNPFNDDIPY